MKDTTGFADTSNTAGGWFGLRFQDNQIQDTSEIVFCDLSFGKAVGLEEPGNQGGAIFIKNYKHVKISNSYIHHNIAKKMGGGIFCNDQSSLNIEQCDISYNRTFFHGGGIFIGEKCDALISRNLIHHNISFRIQSGPGIIVYAGSGGGFYASDAFYKSPVVINNFICNNYSMAGGGLYESTKGIKVIGNVICNNYGTGIYNGHQIGEGVYANNTVCNNENNGGITIHSHYVFVVSNIVRGNHHHLVPNGVQIGTGLGAHPTVEYCNIEDGYEGDGNIDEFPMFAMPTDSVGVEYDALYADWALMDLSPSVNSGTLETSGLFLPELDVADNPRIYGNRIEMGAYENQNMITSVFDLRKEKEQLTIFPNPTSDKFSFNIQNKDPFKAQLFNSSGELVSELIIEINNLEKYNFDISQYPDGTYILLVHSSKTIFSRKIVKN